MFKKTKNWINDIMDAHEGIVAALMIIGLIVLVYGLVFGCYCFTGWILMLIYNLLRPTFNLPELSYWVFVGAAFVIGLFKPSVSVKNKGE